jgi:uncharacterized membrane protein
MKNEHQTAGEGWHNGKFDGLSSSDQNVLDHYNGRRPIARNTNVEFDSQTSFGQRLADKVALFGGSWTFISIFAAVLIVWVLINALLLARAGGTFDPYPYILLNLFLSMLAAIQAPIILMSQNRQSVKDRLDAAHDYQVNLKAELEILSLHEKIDELRESKWSELVEMQQEQIKLLTRLLEGRTETTLHADSALAH